LGAKHFVCSALLTFLPLGVMAQSNSALEACAKLSDDQARLACFDREAAAQTAHEGHAAATAAAATAAPAAAAVGVAAAAPAAATAAAPVAAAPKLSEEQKMGLTPARIQELEKPPGAPPPLKELSLKIQSNTTDGNGHQVFTLENGQVWRQVEPDTRFSVHPGDTVTISHGVLGSYFMSFGSHSNCRVSRVR
jgi:hypothetical protein